MHGCFLRRSRTAQQEIKNMVGPFPRPW
jgi:hypothetical protein